MTNRFTVEYNSKQGFVIVDNSGPVTLCCAGKEMAERVCERLNIAIARGLLRDMGVLQ